MADRITQVASARRKAVVVSAALIAIASLGLVGCADDKDPESAETEASGPLVTETSAGDTTTTGAPEGPTPTAVGVDETLSLETLWRQPLNGFVDGDELPPTMLVASTTDVLVFADETNRHTFQMVALERASGKLIWRSSPTLNGFRIPPLTYLSGKTLVYIEFGALGTEGRAEIGRLVAVDVDTGDELWHHEWLVDYKSWVPMGDRIVLIGTTDSRTPQHAVSMISVADGTELWTYRPERPVVQLLALRSNGIVVALHGEAGAAPRVVGIDLDGGELWSRDDLAVREEAETDVAPSTASEVVALDVRGAVDGVDMASGKTVWSQALPAVFADFDADDISVNTDPVSGVVAACGFAPAKPLYLHVLEASSGAVDWSREIGDGFVTGSFYGFTDGGLVTSPDDPFGRCSPIDLGLHEWPGYSVSVRGARDDAEVWSTNGSNSFIVPVPATGWVDSLSFARIDTVLDTRRGHRDTYDAATGKLLFDDEGLEDQYQANVFGATKVAVGDFPFFRMYLAADPATRIEVDEHFTIVGFSEGVLYVLTASEMLALD